MLDLARRWLPLLLLVPASFAAGHVATEWWTARSSRLVSPPVVAIPALAGTPARPSGVSRSSESQRSVRPPATRSETRPSPTGEASTRRQSRTSSSSEPGDGSSAVGTDTAVDEPLTLDPLPGPEPDPLPEEESAGVP